MQEKIALNGAGPCRERCVESDALLSCSCSSFLSLLHCAVVLGTFDWLAG